MKQRQFNYRRDLSPQLNIARISRWIRSYGRKVRLVPRFERMIRHRAAERFSRRRLFRKKA